MKITLLFFAAVRDLVGRDEQEVELPATVTTIGELSAYLATLHASLTAARMRSIRLARNESFASADERLAPGDVVALIPPVAGG